MEIEFRGMDVKTEKWIYGDLVRIPINNGSYNEPPSLELKTCITDSNSLAKNPVEVKPETVGQYTGHKDKRSVKIYVGDVIESIENINIVKFKKHLGVNCCLCGFINCDMYGEIIGNIHENPKMENNE